MNGSRDMFILCFFVRLYRRESSDIFKRILSLFKNSWRLLQKILEPFSKIIEIFNGKY